MDLLVDSNDNRSISPTLHLQQIDFNDADAVMLHKLRNQSFIPPDRFPYI